MQVLSKFVTGAGLEASSAVEFLTRCRIALFCTAQFQVLTVCLCFWVLQVERYMPGVEDPHSPSGAGLPTQSRSHQMSTANFFILESSKLNQRACVELTHLSSFQDQAYSEITSRGTHGSRRGHSGIGRWTARAPKQRRRSRRERGRIHGG